LAQGNWQNCAHKMLVKLTPEKLFFQKKRRKIQIRFERKKENSKKDQRD
jgi:hypothetical protein